MTFNLTSHGNDCGNRAPRLAANPSRIVPMSVRSAMPPPQAPETPAHVDPVQWYQAIGHARQVCARFFRDGATPTDALQAFGLASRAEPTEWSRAVTAVAHAMCAAPRRMAA